MWVAVSSSHVVSAASSSSKEGVLTLCPCSRLHELLQCGYFPWADFFMKCSSVGPSMGCSPSGTACSSMGPPWGHKPCQQTCSSMGFSLHGFTGPARSLLQPQLLRAHPPAPIQGPSWTAGGYLLHCGPPWAACLPHHGLLHRLQGILCSGT